MQGVAMVDAPHQGQYKATAICWVLGLGTLFAWNSIVTISDYYYNLFPEYHPSRILTCVYQPFALATLAIFSYNEAEVDARRRILVGYALFFIGTFMLIIVDLVTSGSGGIGYFISVCTIVGAFGVAVAHAEGGVVGELSFMCPEFIQSFFAGLGEAGAFISALRLVTKAAFEKHINGLRKGAMLFLGVLKRNTAANRYSLTQDQTNNTRRRTNQKNNRETDEGEYKRFTAQDRTDTGAVLLLCVLLYAIYFPRLHIVKYYRSKAASEGSKTVSADLAVAGFQEQALDIEVKNVANRPNRLSNKQLFMQTIDYALDLFLIYVLTTSIFPGFIFKNTGEHKLGSWYPLVLVTIFNLLDLISRYIPIVQFLKIESRKGLIIANLARFLFVPAFCFTAKYGGQGWMIMLTSVLGLTNGYLSVCVMIVTPHGYMGPEQNALGNILVLCLLRGIFVGGYLNWLWLIGKDTYQNIQLVKKNLGTGWGY